MSTTTTTPEEHPCPQSGGDGEPAGVTEFFRRLAAEEQAEALAAVRASINAAAKEGRAANIKRQLSWLGIEPGEVFALQTLGPTDQAPSYLGLCRSIDEAVALTHPSSLAANNRWGKTERINFQGIYLVANRLVGRIDEVVEPGKWVVMPKGVITDERIAVRRHFYLDLDTQRRDEFGRALTLPISATLDELLKTISSAIKIEKEIVEALGLLGVGGKTPGRLSMPYDAVARMMSGNGIQLWFRLDDIPETNELHQLVRELLAIWSARYDSDVSHVDFGVHDAKRIGPLAGTTKKKGVNVSLHRRVTFTGAPEPIRITLEQLQRLVLFYRKLLTVEQRAAVAKTLGIRPKPRPAAIHTTRGGRLSSYNRLPIRDVAAKLGIDPEKPVCPNCGEGGAASDVAFLDDRNLLNCKHKRCAARPNRTCADLVAKVVFGIDNLRGTTGVVAQVSGWFQSNFPGALS